MGVEKKIGISKEERLVALKYANRYRLTDHKVTVRRMSGRRVLFFHGTDEDGLEYEIRFTRIQKMRPPKGWQVVNKLHYLKVQAEKVHGDIYDLSLVKEVKWREKFPIICPTHGVFYKHKSAFISQGEGCPKCAKNRYKNNRKYYKS